MPYQSRNPSEALKRRRLLGLLAAAPLLTVVSACGHGEGGALVGAPLPELAFADLEGRPWNSRELHGAPVMINVWASWCHPCRAEMAGLDRLYRSLRSSGLRLIGVSVDEDINLAREFVRQSEISFPIVSDPKGRAMTPVLGTSAIPASLLVGRDGRIRRLVLGERVWDQGEARTWVGEILT